jgi:preprotein translocase subunit SecA
MVQALLKKFFGTKNDRELKRIGPIVEAINAYEPMISSLSDHDLKEKTVVFRERLNAGEALDDILPEAFAVVREASKRVLGMRHYDVQMIGGIVLHEGKISEMKTGEGKTLVATLPVYLNALDGRGAHVITVNDYLARRDAEWMGPLYNFLGLSVGVILHGLTDQERQEAYGSDITYGTNNEFGFDYLRDNMKYDINEYVQRELNYCIVDEVDSILVDEARTPLIISGPSEESTDKYYTINRIVPRLKHEADFTIEEKTKGVVLTDEGNIKAEKHLASGNLYDPENIELVHHILQALRAHHLYKKDVDYVVKDGEVIIVDEFTGRLMPGRRWSDGLHQAIEAKEGVKIENENQTLATITFQNYFRMYNKLSGMTGTADTEAAEFAEIYNLDVMVIPTNQPMIRIDQPDVIYKTEAGKFNAIAEEIALHHEKGQPVLVGTISIEKSEVLSRMLKKSNITHSVLNAKHHDREAEIITQAGRSDAVTIATNMAGRGTDIVLGGNREAMARELIKDIESPTPEQYTMALEKAGEICDDDREKVLEAGGLYIMGTERHESRRIDNQLRGRSGRQGDEGESRFFLSLEDDLMRIFGSDRVSGLMDKIGFEDDMPIENRLITKAVEGSQKKVEAHNFDIRKHLLEYDDIMNKQRTEIYSYRREILLGEGTRERVREMTEDTVEELVDIFCPADKYSEEWDMKGLLDEVFGIFGVHLEDIPPDRPTEEFIREMVWKFYEDRESKLGSEISRRLERFVLLEVVDTQWKDHLLAMDHLKEGIGLRGYGQRDPLNEYKREAFDMFSELGGRITREALSRLFRIQIREEGEVKRASRAPRQANLNYNISEDGPVQPVKRAQKVGRNDPCPCGSGKKYKKCCGKDA